MRTKTSMFMALTMAVGLAVTQSVQALDNVGTGGTITYTDVGGSIVGAPVVGGDVIHTFTNSGSYSNSYAVSAAVLVVAGGGGGGNNGGGGGGAGGVIYSNAFPLVAGSNYNVTVGAGGNGGEPSGNGSNSVFATFNAVGGGGGGSRDSDKPGHSGGSGGGGGSPNPGTTAAGGTGQSGQGKNGGYGKNTSPYGGGGGGGALVAGANSTTGTGAKGGDGATNSISGSSVVYGGGGGGGCAVAGTVGAGGTGGGGTGAATGTASNGVANTGGGGGGGATPGNGGSGIVIVRYPYYYDDGVLAVTVTAPTNGQTFLAGASISATATVSGGTPPYTVTFYTNYNTGAYGQAGSTNASPYAVSLGTLADGTYDINAKVTDSASPTNATATSATNTFTCDGTPPTLAGSGIVDNKSGGPVVYGEAVTYTVTFSEAMDASTVSAADFGNAGSAAATITSVTQTGPAIFSVQVTPTGTGTLQLRVNAGSVLKDSAGNALNTSSAIPDDTTLTVNQRPVTVTADAKTKNYGDADPALTYQITSGLLVGSDSFSGALARNTGETVGLYAITQGTLALNANYTLTYAGANLTINQRPVTVTADAKTKLVGDPDPALTCQITSGSLIPGDSFSGALARNAGETVGLYAITKGTLALNANYTLTYVGANLRISTPRWWDGTNTGGNGNGASDGGTATWNTSTVNWDNGNGVARVAWVNANNDYAVFAGTAGTVTLGTGITVGGLQFDTAGYVIAGNTLTFGAACAMTVNADATISSVLAGSGTLTKAGAGTLILTGNNTYTGPTSVTGGALQWNRTASGTTAILFNTNRTFSVSNGSGGSIAINGTTSSSSGGNGGVIFDLGTSLTNSGAVTITGQNSGSEWGIRFGNGGTETIHATSGTNTLIGINTGTGAPFNFNYLTTVSLIADPGAAIVLTDGSGTASGQTVFRENDQNNPSILNITGDVTLKSTYGTNSSTFWSTSSTLAKNTQINVLTGGNLTLDGGLTSMATYLKVTSDGTLVTIASACASGSTMGGTRIINAGSLAYNISGAGVLTQSGIISGAGALTKAGSGTLTLSGANTYTGTTTVNAGKLKFGANNVIYTGAVTVDGVTAVLDVTGYSDTVGTVTLAGGGALTGGTLTNTATFEMQSGSASTILAGAGIALNKTTAGTVTLSGTNTYTGATTVNAGTLLVNGYMNAATNVVTVNAGAALGGTGTIGGNVTIADNGHLAFQLSTNAASQAKLALAPGKSLTFSGTSVLDITKSGDLLEPGVYTLVTAPDGIVGSLPAVNMPPGWSATVTTSNNDLKLNVTGRSGTLLIVF